MKLAPTLIAAALAALAGSAFAQVNITHNQALAGNVTPGDAPGYPITISAPGHYRLTSNLTVPAGTGGILITASNVTLDLNGYTVGGPVTCTVIANNGVSCSLPPDYSYNQYGIKTDTYQENIVVRNGNVQGFAGYGVYLLGKRYELANLNVNSNSSTGAVVGSANGGSGRVVGSTFSLNASDGAIIRGGLITRSTFSNNGHDGVSIEATAIIDSVASYNANRGIEGDSHNPGAGVYGTPSTVSGSTVMGNKNGATIGLLISLGGNFNGSAPF